MKVDFQEIDENVSQLEGERAEYTKAAIEWEKMWLLKAFSQTPKEALNDGREQVTVPTPFNVVHMARRLIASEPKIQVPEGENEEGYSDPVEGEDTPCETRERWLSAYWQRASREQQRDIISDMAWQVLVRGRFVLEVKWVREELPEKFRDKRLPILMRTLDPLAVGVKRGPLWTEFAYHKYMEERRILRRRYPKAKLESKTVNSNLAEQEKIEVIDYWYLDNVGNVWNCVVADREEWLKRPYKTDYPDIPIIEGYGDSAPVSREEWKGLSILHPIRQLWPYHCRLASQIGTGLLYYFWPAVTVQNDQGNEVPNISIKPGTTTPLPAGTKVEFLRGDVNVPLAQSMISMIDGQSQQSTFPGVMYGDSGAMQAGFGVSILADQARGRVQQFRQNLEAGIEKANEMLLALVESMGGEEGVKVWGNDARDGSIYQAALTANKIQGNYSNNVSLMPQITTDDLQKQTLGLRMVQVGALSNATFRDKFLTIQLPMDEQDRIDMERAMSTILLPKAQLKAIEKYYPNSWQTLIAGTQLEQVAQAEEQAVMQAEMGQMGMPGQNGQQSMQSGPQSVSAPPQAGGSGMPPMPPGMTPEMLQMMMQQGPPGQAPQPGMGMQGVPEEMMGQLSPEMMGMQGAPPGMYQDMMGQPLSPDEELMLMAGLTPQMRGQG